MTKEIELEADGWEAVAVDGQYVDELERALGVEKTAREKAEVDLEATRRDLAVAEAELADAKRQLLEKDLQLGEANKLVKELKRRNSLLEALVPWLSSPIKEVI